jgi:hypothetical protein
MPEIFQQPAPSNLSPALQSFGALGMNPAKRAALPSLDLLQFL